MNKIKKKSTAVKWLCDRLKLSLPEEMKILKGLVVIAKEMEKEQIMDSYIMGSYDFGDKIFRPTDYYNETFKSE